MEDTNNDVTKLTKDTDSKSVATTTNDNSTIKAKKDVDTKLPGIY